MKWKKMLFYFLTCVFLTTGGYSEELIKLGTYDFQDAIREMSDEPFLRKQLPDALGSPLFVSLMLKDRADRSSRPSKDPWLTQSENYGRHFIQDALWKSLQKRADNYQKSRTMRNNLVLGLSLAHQYRGYSIILKPQTETLFSDTNLNIDIASVLADYLARGPQEYNVEESVEESPSTINHSTEE